MLEQTQSTAAEWADVRCAPRTTAAPGWPAGWWLPGLSPAEAQADQDSAEDSSVAGKNSAEQAVPAWARFIETALDADLNLEPMSEVPSTAGLAVFEPVIRPLVEHGCRELYRMLDGRPLAAGALGAAGRNRPVLVARLTRTIARTLLAELQDSVELAVTTDLDGHRQLAALLHRRGSAAGLRDLLVSTPLLARLLGIQCLGFVDAVAELVLRLSADLPAIAAGLLGADPSRVTSLELGSGDVHRGGRSVAVVGFADGTRVVYKPRSGAVQTHLRALLAWYREALPQTAPRLPATVARLDYCWEEFIDATPCADADAVDRFYRRQGSLLALLHVLGCTDVHFENVIAHGDEPVVIDIETVFHPVVAHERLQADPAAETLVRSVARVGLLPLMMDGESDRLDVSGLGGGAAGPTPHEVAVVVAAGTDAMRLERAPIELGLAPNRPELDGVRMEPAEHTAALLAGFRLGYEVLSAHPDTVLALAQECADDEVRVVVRDSYLYAAVLDEAMHPTLLGDAETLDRFYRQIGELTDDPQLAPLVDGEVAELWNGDIPVMTSTPAGHEVRSGHAGAGSCHVAESALERTAGTLRQLTPRDRRVQEWVVEASLATRGPLLRHAGTVGANHNAAEDADRDRLIAQACGIADELCATARENADRVNWLGLDPADGERWSVAPLGAGLGDGYTGVALFLTALHRVTGLQRYAEVAGRAVVGLPALIAEWTVDADAAAEIGGGAMDGLGGIAWATAHLGAAAILPNGLLDEVLVLCRRVVDAAGQDGSASADVAGGLAGLAVTMRAIANSAVAPETAATAAGIARTTLRLVSPAGADAGRGGALHGPAAAAWALSPLAPTLRSVRLGSADPDPSWCSGLSGRLAVLDAPAGEVEAAVSTLAELGPLQHHGTCHGELGVLEALLVLSRRGNATAARTLRVRAAALLGSIAATGPLCATPGSVSTPGFLHGLAGVGYGLLRLAEPHNVSSVLLFDPVGVRPTAT